VQEGNQVAALASLESVSERAPWMFDSIQHDPGLQAIRGTPEFQDLVRGMADRFLRSVEINEKLGQTELRMISRAHLVLGQTEASVRALRLALEHGGPYDEAIRSELLAIEARQP
jgi:hypothetical protein